MKTLPTFTRHLLHALALLLAPAAFAQTPQAKQPNIIVILCDDMGFSDLGCYGGEIATPNLDKLAQGGVRFTQFYNTARCCPTRAALLSGLYSHQAGIGHMIEDKGLDGFRGELNKRCVTIAEALKPAGYRSYAVGKWHVARNVAPDGPKHDWPLQRGFERYYGTITGAGNYFDPGTLTRDNTAISSRADAEYRPASYYYTDAIADHAIRFASEHAHDHAGEPFFLYVAFTAAHWPLHARPEDIAKYSGKYDAGYDAIRHARFEKAKQLGVIDAKWTLSPTVGDWEKVEDKKWEARCMEVYAAQVDRMDQNVGRIVAALEKNGQLENTLVLFLQDNGGCAETIGRDGNATRSDRPTLPVLSADALMREVRPKQTRDGFPLLGGHGVMPGPEDTFISYGEGWANVSNTPFRLYKHFEHEGGISTPFIAHWPAGISAARWGAVENQPAHLIDIMATCVDLAGAKYPAQNGGEIITPMQGVSLRAAFGGGAVKREAPIFFEHEGNRAIRDGKWKLVAKKPGGKWELYDTEADRTEMNDVAAAQPEIVKGLMAKWETWGKSAGVLPWPWKPQYGATADGKSRFELKQGDDLSGDDAPEIAHHTIAIHVEIMEAASDGVLIAQGGSSEGYSLYMKGGRPFFATRHGGKLETISAADALPAGAAKLAATLAADGTMKLDVGEKNVAAAKSSLFKKEPKDGLQVGADKNGAVGEYTAPFEFKGKLGAVTLDLGK
jgi:arylsulfatase